MIRSLLNRWRLERALAKRRRNRATYSAAGKRGAANAIHNQFQRDPLMRAGRGL
jgi:hypothetical protein